MVARMAKINFTQEFAQLSSQIDRSFMLPKRGNRGMFQLCLRSSFVKCVEFNERVNKIKRKSDHFFFIPSLRSICEDLIVLTSVRRFSPNERDKIILAISTDEYLRSLESQTIFFIKNHPKQPLTGRLIRWIEEMK